MNDFFLFLKDNWISITGTIGVAIAWIVDKKNRKEDTKLKQGSAMETMQTAYDKFVEDAQKQYDSLIFKIAGFEEREKTAIEERENLKDKLENLQDKIIEYEKKIKDYEGQVSAYKLKVERLTRELSKYKK